MEYLKLEEDLKMQDKIFDICGTLYNSNTTMDFCEYQCKNKSYQFILHLSKSIAGKVTNKILMKSFGYDFIRALHVKALKGLTKQTINNDATLFVNNYLENHKIDEVHRLFDKYNKEEIILVSATLEPIAQAIAKKLGDLKYFSTTLEYKKDTCLGKIKNDLLGNKQNYFDGRELKFIITDNKSDLKLCKMANEVVIVSKKKNLNFWKNQDLKIEKIIEV